MKISIIMCLIGTLGIFVCFIIAIIVNDLQWVKITFITSSVMMIAGLVSAFIIGELEDIKEARKFYNEHKYDKESHGHYK
jgi:uncharacterized protein YacL